MMARSGQHVKKLVYVNKEQGQANSCLIIAEIQFNQFSFEKVTSLISLQMFVSITIFNILPFQLYLYPNLIFKLDSNNIQISNRLLFSIFKIRRNQQQMLGTFGKICDDRKEYILRHQKNMLKKKFNQEELIFQTQALDLIQKQMVTSNVLAFAQAIQTISRKRKRDAFDTMFHFSSTILNTNHRLLDQFAKRIELFQWKIMRIKNEKQRIYKKESFRELERRDKLISKINLIMKIADNYQIRKKIFDIKAVESEKHFVHLNFLDISQICPKGKISEIFQIHGKVQEGTIKQKQNQQELCALRRQIIRKQQEIQEYQKQQERQILQLKQKVGRKKQKEIPTDETFSFQRAEEVLISKLIRKNFQLEEKLETVYELLNSIQSDQSSTLSKLLSAVTKKRYLNVELQKFQV